MVNFSIYEREREREREREKEREREREREILSLGVCRCIYLWNFQCAFLLMDRILHHFLIISCYSFQPNCELFWWQELLSRSFTSFSEECLYSMLVVNSISIYQ
jgi:hypothetical protein